MKYVFASTNSGGPPSVRSDLFLSRIEPAENSEKIAASERPTTTSLAASDSLANALNLAFGKITEPLACWELPCSTANFDFASAVRSCAFEVFLTSTTFDS
jgi:hypothetical protein